ncbi:5' nucleotidase family protein [Teladorsagia circumcincta]|uniref:5' nucleotidase family protein n=1 Tax=Teladorsagia circumcincta TaxID=45464 RepID=A0A2G9V4M3_TELCI|nr:5' nucleotidase family protein [Teladorsagia circumcincta]
MEKIGDHFGPFQKRAVYSRGRFSIDSNRCATAFIQQMGLAGKDILYVGDHIFGDVLKSKKAGGWRTLLIVPELNREMEASRTMKIWSRQAEKFHELNDLNNSLNTPEAKEDVGAKKEILREIARITDDMEAEFGAMGSLLRCGWRQTYFASQVKKYADIYTFNVYNIVEYSPLHCFNSPIYLLPHEEKFLHNIACKAAQGVQGSEEIGTQEEGKAQPSET